MYESMILKAVDGWEDTFALNGKKHKNTMEIIGARFSMIYELKEFDYASEVEKVSDRMGVEDYFKKMKTEEHHYQMFYHSLKHKLIEIGWYFKEKINETRKCIAFSTDCISMINIFQRGEVLYAFVHMRSSDYKSLLPVDLLHINNILVSIAEESETGIKKIFASIAIASLHYYLDGGRK